VSCDTGVRTRLREYEAPGDRRQCNEVLQQSEVCKLHDCDSMLICADCVVIDVRVVLAKQ